MRKYFLLKVVLLVCLIFNSFEFYGQNSVNDEFQHINNLCRKHIRTPDSLLLYSQKLLNFSLKNNLLVGEKNAYRYMGLANTRLKKYEKSNRYYYKALSLAKKSNDERLKYVIYNNLSLNHRVTKYHDSSLYYSRKLLLHLEFDNDKRSLSMTYMNMGLSFFANSELDSAVVYLKKSIKGFSESKAIRFVSSNLSILAEVYFQKGNYKKALAIADSSLIISKRANLKMNYSRNYNLLARAHEKLNNTKESKKYSILADKNKPSNIDNRIIRTFNESSRKSKYKFDKKEKERVLNENKFYKSNLFLVLFFTVCLVFISVYFYRKFQKVRREVLIMQKNLDKYLENEVVEAVQLIHLKSKAIIDVHKLMYVKSDGHYVEFYIEGKIKPEIDRNSLIEVLKLLPTNNFIRIHKSYIINIKFIKIINSTKLMLSNGKWINLPRTYKTQLKELLYKT